MAGSNPSRGKESTVFLVVAGQTLVGSFSKVKRWSVKPDAEIRRNGYVGNKVSKRDLITDGGTFDLELDVFDSNIVREWKKMVDADVNGTAPPTITVVIIQKHRDPSTPSLKLALQACVAKLDDYGAGGMKDNMSSTLSGEYEEMKPL